VKIIYAQAGFCAIRPGMTSNQEHEAIGDPNAPYEPPIRKSRKQLVAERLRESVSHMHYHQWTGGESEGSYYSHTHDGWDVSDHTHEGRQAFPRRQDGGYWEESGPSLGTETPKRLAEYQRIHVIPNVAAILGRPTPRQELMRWRLRLYCGRSA
jgi:hypothetical protein